MRLMILAVITAALPLSAQNLKTFDVKLGLWESTTQTEMPGMSSMPGIPAEALAQMPPEQRARLEAMMKGRGAGGPGAIKTKYCLTEESLKQGQVGQVDKSCTYKVVSSSPSKQVIHMDCKKDGTTMTGDMTVVRVDEGHYTATVAMKSSGGEVPVNVKMSLDNKWLSSNCGSVKPVVAK